MGRRWWCVLKGGCIAKEEGCVLRSVEWQMGSAGRKGSGGVAATNKMYEQIPVPTSTVSI